MAALRRVKLSKNNVPKMRRVTGVGESDNAGIKALTHTGSRDTGGRETFLKGVRWELKTD